MAFLSVEGKLYKWISTINCVFWYNSEVWITCFCVLSHNTSHFRCGQQWTSSKSFRPCLCLYYSIIHLRLDWWKRILITRVNRARVAKDTSEDLRKTFDEALPGWQRVWGTYSTNGKHSTSLLLYLGLVIQQKHSKSKELHSNIQESIGLSSIG